MLLSETYLMEDVMDKFFLEKHIPYPSFQGKPPIKHDGILTTNCIGSKLKRKVVYRNTGIGTLGSWKLCKNCKIFKKILFDFPLKNAIVYKAVYELESFRLEKIIFYPCTDFFIVV